jgi:hypothetical protein
LRAKREIAVQQISVNTQSDNSFESYCLLRSMEWDLKMEDSYDFVKFMLALQTLKDPLAQLGIVNLIPVGSSVTKTIRKESYMLDIILNFNKAQVSDFNSMVSDVEALFTDALSKDGLSYHV